MDTINKIRLGLIAFAMGFVVLLGLTATAGIANRSFKIADSDSVVCLDPDTNRIDLVKDSLIVEVDAYLKKCAPNTKLRGKDIVENCLYYDVDIAFVLAQAQIESNFGTAGIAKRTNSPWNVGAYDGRSASTMIKKGYGYKDPNESISRYLELLKTKYLVNGKDEYDMMKKYVTKGGARYASSRTYEYALTRTFNKINQNTRIDELLNQYKVLMANECKDEHMVNDTSKILA